MTTKTFYLGILFFVLTISARAQEGKGNTEKERPAFGVRLGANMNKFIGKSSDGKTLDHDFIIGAQIRVNVEIPLMQSLYFQPNFLVAIKGSKLKYRNLGQDVTATTTLSYVEIPLLILFKPTIGKGNALIGVGPYAACAISGSYRTSPGTKETISFTNSYKSTDDGNYVRRFDAGMSMILGVQLSNRFFAHLNGQLSLMKINPKISDIQNDQTSAKNLSFGLSVGYRFHPRKKKK